MTKQEFLNQLWHYPNEDNINSEKPIIAYLKNGNVVKVRYIKYQNIFINNEINLEKNDIIKFYYMEDLI